MQTNVLSIFTKWWKATHSCARSTAFTKPRAYTQPITCNTIPQKDNMIPCMAQSCHSLNSQVFAIFFPFATIPATAHYPVFTDRYSPQYGMLMFLLHFMTNTFFWHYFPFPLPPLPPLCSESHSRSKPCTLPSLSFWQNFFWSHPHLPSAIHQAVSELKG